MKSHTLQSVLDVIRDEDVEFVRLQFTDTFGTLKNIAVTSDQIPRIFERPFPIEGSSFQKDGMGEEERLYLIPDLSSFAILPWRPQTGRVARLLCDLYMADRTPCRESVRYLLKKVSDEAAEKGYTFYVKPECEFFLFHTDDNGVATTLTHEKAGYLDLSPVDLAENVRRDIVLALEEMGFPVESSHHERSAGQQEIDCGYLPASQAADQIMTLKMTVRSIAKRHGLHATFMPKPKNGCDGSGMHIQMKLMKDGENIFVEKDAPDKLSRDGMAFINGILKHSAGMAVFTNPIVNSYKRLSPGWGAGAKLSWPPKDSESVIRTWVGYGGVRKVELCSPDCAANPYMIFALLLSAGLEGMEEGRTYREQDSPKTEGRLPANLGQAIEAFAKDPFAVKILGEPLTEKYLKQKMQEWDTYEKLVTPWEVEEYLHRI